MKRKHYRVTPELIERYLSFGPLFDELWYMGVNTKRRLRLFAKGAKQLKELSLQNGWSRENIDNTSEAREWLGDLMKRIDALPNGPLYKRPTRPENEIVL